MWNYKQFKAKTKGQDYDSLGILMIELWGLGFFKECIWWSKRILEDNRLCEKFARLRAFYVLLISYNDLHDYENALDSGKKCLEFCSVLGDDDRARQITKVAFEVMRNASLQLKRNEDAFKYAKEILKIDVMRFNKKEIEKYEILKSYHKVIEMLMTNGDFGRAHKMIEKRLTLFSLNSINPNDVKTGLQKEDYGMVLTLNNFLKEYDDDMVPALLSAFGSISEHLEHFFTKVQSFYYVAKICWQKHEIHFYCDDLQTNFEWGHMAWQILDDIILHLRQFTLTQNQSYKYIDNCLRRLNESKGYICGSLSVKNLFIDYISVTLLLADYSKRNHLYLCLANRLLGHLDAQIVIVEEREDMVQYSGLEKNASFYILEALRTNEKLDAQKVMPFIEFCLKTVCGKNKVFILPTLVEFYGNFHGENGLKVQLLTLKNSLAIANYMKVNINKTEEPH